MLRKLKVELKKMDGGQVTKDVSAPCPLSLVPKQSYEHFSDHFKQLVIFYA